MHAPSLFKPRRIRLACRQTLLQLALQERIYTVHRPAICEHRSRAIAPTPPPMASASALLLLLPLCASIHLAFSSKVCNAADKLKRRCWPSCPPSRPPLPRHATSRPSTSAATASRAPSRRCSSAASYSPAPPSPASTSHCPTTASRAPSRAVRGFHVSRNRLTGDASPVLSGAGKPVRAVNLARNKLRFDLSGVEFPREVEFVHGPQPQRRLWRRPGDGGRRR